MVNLAMDAMDGTPEIVEENFEEILKNIFETFEKKASAISSSFFHKILPLHLEDYAKNIIDQLCIIFDPDDLDVPIEKIKQTGFIISIINILFQISLSANRVRLAKFDLSDSVQVTLKFIQEMESFGWTNYIRDDLSGEEEKLGATADLLSEFTNFLKEIERERLLQIESVFDNTLYNGPKLRIDCLGYSNFDDDLYDINLQPIEGFQTAKAISSCMRILHSDFGDWNILDCNMIIETLRELNSCGLWKISSSLFCIIIEYCIRYETEDASSLHEGSVKDTKSMSELYFSYPEEFKPNIQISLARLYNSDKFEAFKSLDLFLPKTILAYEYLDSELILRKELGEDIWGKLDKKIKEELIVAEDLFRALQRSNHNKNSNSIPGAIVHWSRVLERLLKVRCEELITDLDLTQVADSQKSFFKKIFTAKASLGELVNMLLEFDKRIKGHPLAKDLSHRFAISTFAQRISKIDQFREALRLISRIRNHAPHDAPLAESDVFLFRFNLYTSGLLKSLIEVGSSK